MSLDPAPAYFMWLTWRDDQIAFIRDYRYDRYVVRDAELILARPATTPATRPRAYD